MYRAGGFLSDASFSINTMPAHDHGAELNSPAHGWGISLTVTMRTPETLLLKFHLQVMMGPKNILEVGTWKLTSLRITSSGTLCSLQKSAIPCLNLKELAVQLLTHI